MSEILGETADLKKRIEDFVGERGEGPTYPTQVAKAFDLSLSVARRLLVELAQEGRIADLSRD